MANDTTTGAPTTGADPFQEAEQNPLPVKQTVWERLNTGSGIPMVDEALKRDFMQKQAQANLYHSNAAQLNGLLLHLSTPEGKTHTNPQTGQPYTDDDIAQLQLQRDHAWGQYEKLVGIDKQSKGALQKAKSIVDFIHGNAAQRGAMAPPPTPDYPTTVSDASGVTQTGVAAPRQPGPAAQPSSYATNVGDAGVSYDPSKANAPLSPSGLTPPPLSPLQQAVRASTQLPFATHPAKVGQAISDTLQAQQAQFTQGITQRTEEARKLFDGDITSPAAQRYIATGTFPPFHGLQKSTLVDPSDGEPVIFDPMQGTYARQDGRQVDNPIPQQKPQMVEVVMPNGDHAIAYEQYKKLTDQQGNPLPVGTKKFYSQMAERETTTKTWKTVQQPDGSTALVPVVNESVMRRGGMATPPAAGAAPAGGQGALAPTGKTGFPSGVTPSKPPNAAKSSPPNNAAAAMGLPPGSKIVGGKVPPGVSKAYDAYNGSVTRFKVMQEALPKALKGDQQAMINLLYNHIGMTTGLQKGGRITQPIIDEAQNSAPWEATILKRIGVGNEFEMQPDLLRGVVIDPQTMHNMIGLAEDRVNNEYAAWQREIGSAKTGYGMTTPPPATPPDIQPTGKTGKPNTFKPF